MQVYCLNINALTRRTTFSVRLTVRSVTWFITLQCHLFSIFVYILHFFSCSNATVYDWCHYWLPKAQCSLVNACVTSLAANFYVSWWLNVTRSLGHKFCGFTRARVQQSFLITGFVFHWRITRQWRWSVCLLGPGNNAYNVIIHINKSHDLPEAERAPFYLSVQIPEKCTFGNDGTTKQNWQYFLRSLSLFKMLAWIKYTKCLNEVLRWASSPRETISCKLHKCSTNLISIWFQKVLCFYRFLIAGTLKCWW